MCVAILQSPRFKSAAARDKDGMTASLSRAVVVVVVVVVGFLVLVT